MELRKIKGAGGFSLTDIVIYYKKKYYENTERVINSTSSQLI